METNKVHVLIKFGEKNHMLDLFENGTVYMNTISYFRDVENDSQRQDKHEGTFSMAQVQWLKIKCQKSGSEIEFSRTGDMGRLVSAQLRETYPDFRGNLYCMYGISTEWTNMFDQIDSRNIGFGGSESYMVVIHNPTNFINRIKAVVKETGLRGGHSGITYYDPETYEGELGIFYKPVAFDYQSEFRIFVENPDDEPLCITIGSLHDIAFIIKVDNLENLRIKFEDIVDEK